VGYPGLNITQYWSGLFSLESSSSGIIQFYPAVNCTEKYKDGPASLLAQFYEEPSVLASTGWLCPDVDELVLQNYFGATAGYSSYYFTVTYCDIAANSLGFYDPNCIFDHA
jgi:hypothetical protein